MTEERPDQHRMDEAHDAGSGATAGRDMTGGSDGAVDGGTGGHAPGGTSDVYGNESADTPSTEPHPDS